MILERKSYMDFKQIAKDFEVIMAFLKSLQSLS